MVLNKEGNLLKTGFRLINILKILYQKDCSKSDIIEYFKNEYNQDVSRETIKVDINTLIYSGCNIKRGTKANGYKYSADKDFAKIHLLKNEADLIKKVKNTALDILDYKEIADFVLFYKKLSSVFDDKFKMGIFDYKIFNKIDIDILKQIEKIIEEKKNFTFLYDSPSRGITEIEASPYDISWRNSKLYMNCFSKGYNGQTHLRMDNIKKIIKVTDRKDSDSFSEKKLKARYIVKKSTPLESFERIIKENQDGTVLIETHDMNEFFIVQRLALLGENCVSVETKSVKRAFLKLLKETLELYQ